MGRVNPVEQAMSKLGLSIQSIVIVAALAFIVGVFESSMSPFASPVYIAAAALTYAASVQWGLFDGIFVAAGMMMLLMLSSIFRAKDPSLLSFFSEMPADFILFFALGVLPGFAVELFAGSTREIDAERASTRRRIADLSSKLQQVGREKRAAADNTKVDEGKWNRRGNQLADASRRMVAAESVTEVLEVLGGTLFDGLQPERFFLAVADGAGGLAVSRVEPAPEAEPGPIPGDEQTVMGAVRGGKAAALPAPAPIGTDGLIANVLAPIVVNKQLVALVGLHLAEPKEELEFITVLAHLAQEVSGRFGLPA